MLRQTADLARWLPQLKNNNAQGEYYLTDIISMAVKDHTPIASMTVKDPLEVQGINNRLQLQQLQRVWQQRKAEKFLEQGVMIADSQRFDCAAN